MAGTPAAGRGWGCVIIAISNNLVFHGKRKHFNIKFFFLRDLNKEGYVGLKYCKTDIQHQIVLPRRFVERRFCWTKDCKTDIQLADIFTKPFPKSKFEFLREKLGVSSN